MSSADEINIPSAIGPDPPPINKTKKVQRKSLWDKAVGGGAIKKRKFRPKKLAKKVRKNFLHHKSEFIIQFFLLVACIVGTVKFFEEVEKLGLPKASGLDDRAVRIAKAQFTLPNLLCFGLMFNVGANVPAVTPLLACLSYYWYPEGIAYLDRWYYEMDPHEDDLERRTSDITYEVIDDTGTYKWMCIWTGVVLVASLLCVMVETSFPTFNRLRETGVIEGCAFLCVLASFGGLITIWHINGNDYDSRNEDTYDLYLKVSVQGLISIGFVVDAILYPDPAMTNISFFMVGLTAMGTLSLGLQLDLEQYRDGTDENKEQQRILLGFLAVGCSLVFQNLLVVIAPVVLDAHATPVKVKHIKKRLRQAKEAAMNLPGNIVGGLEDAGHTFIDKMKDGLEAVTDVAGVTLFDENKQERSNSKAKLDESNAKLEDAGM